MLEDIRKFENFLMTNITTINSPDFIESFQHLDKTGIIVDILMQVVHYNNNFEDIEISIENNLLVLNEYFSKLLKKTNYESSNNGSNNLHLQIYIINDILSSIEKMNISNKIYTYVEEDYSALILNGINNVLELVNQFNEIESNILISNIIINELNDFSRNLIKYNDLIQKRNNIIEVLFKTITEQKINLLYSINANWELLTYLPVNISKNLNYSKKYIIVVVLFIIIISLITGIITTCLLIKKINLIKAGTAKFILNNYDYRINLPANDELGQLASAFNNMAAEIKTKNNKIVHSEKMVLLGNFTACIAHELNTPLNGIIIYLKLLIDNIKYNDIKDDLDDILNEAYRCKNIIESLLNLSKKNQLKIEKIKLNDLIQDIIKLIQPQNKDKQIKYNIDNSINNIIIKNDLATLRHILINIILNSVQAIDSAGIINILFKNNILKIVDTGKGIKSENIPKIFEPFWSTRKDKKGTGLGMFIVYSMVKQLGWDIEIESQENKGTSVNLIIKS